MKLKLHLSFLLLLFITTASPAQEIDGSWSWSSEDGDMFTLDLREITDNSYRGNHCSVYLQGDRLDCYDAADEFTVVLIRKAENIFEGSIRSTYSLTTGNFQLQYLPLDDILLFTLTAPPEGEYYIPLEAELQR